jgi:hypothetical protein
MVAIVRKARSSSAASATARERAGVRASAFALEIPVALQQLSRGLRADAPRAGNVVGRVATQADQIGHLIRTDPVALNDAVGIDVLHLADARDGTNDGRAGRGQLVRVAVVREDERGAPGGLLEGGQRRADVIRLPRRNADGGDAERADEHRQGIQLVDQGIVGLADALRLVRRDESVALGLLAAVDGEGDRARREGIPGPHEHADRPLQQTDRPAVRGRDRPQCVVGAMRQRIAIDDQEGLALRHPATIPVRC